MKDARMNKKGVITLGEAPTIVLVLVTLAIFLAVGALVLAEIQSNDLITTGSVAENATLAGLAGLETLASFQTVIAVVIAAALILGIIFLIRA